MGIEPITRNLQGFVATLVHAPPYTSFGGNSGTRTCDLSLIRGVLYQLSYISNTGGGYGIRTHLIPSVQAKCPLQADPTPILFGGSSRTRTYHLTVISRVL